MSFSMALYVVLHAVLYRRSVQVLCVRPSGEEVFCVCKCLVLSLFVYSRSQRRVSIIVPFSIKILLCSAFNSAFRLVNRCV